MNIAFEISVMELLSSHLDPGVDLFESRTRPSRLVLETLDVGPLPSA